MNLQRPSFVGLTKGETELDMKLIIPEDGTYRLLLHAGSKSDEVKATIDGQAITFQKITDDRHKTVDYLDVSYYYADITIKKSHPTLSLQNRDQNAIMVDSVMAVPAADLPSDFRYVDKPGLQIKITDDPLLLDIKAEVQGAK
jgi:hypothetical protein